MVSSNQPKYKMPMSLGGKLSCIILGLVFILVPCYFLFPQLHSPEITSELQTPGLVGLNSIILIVFAGVIIFGMLKGMEIVGDTEEEKSTDDYWVQYGERLKSAYTSKFFGENSGFNQEVDARVNIMMNNGRGITRILAKDWLKRIHKFTESK
jgi:hypothetical protein